MWDLSFWFDVSPSLLSPVFERGFFLVFALLIILGSVVRIVARHRQDDKLVIGVFQRVGRLLLTMGLIGLVWFFFAYEQTYFLGARFWFLLWLVGLIVWVLMIVRYVRVTMPQKREQMKSRQESNQYLPRRVR